MRGVAYQDQGHLASQATTIVDPLEDGLTCERDIPYLKQLNTNVVRLYATNPTRDHSACMKALADADIYVLTDPSCPIPTAMNWEAPSWNTALYDYWTATIDYEANYTNTLGLFVGTEVATDKNTTDAVWRSPKPLLET